MPSKKRSAKLQDHSNAFTKNHNRYDYCRCGGVKAMASALCRQCRTDTRHTKVSAKVFYIEDEPCRYISLTRGQKAIVDATLFDHLSQWNWFSRWSPHTQSYYVYRKIGEKGFSMQRQIIGAEGYHVDHKNHNTLDNRRSNLRWANHSQSMMNRNRIWNKLGYVGVYYKKRDDNYCIEVTKNGKVYTKGGFDTPEAAAQARDELALKHHGEFASLNFKSIVVVSGTDRRPRGGKTSTAQISPRSPI
jgi:hypothetical protein